jgi:putative DNA methylase
MLRDPRALTPVLYGLDRWDKLFTERQLVALTTFSDLIGEVHDQILFDPEAPLCLSDEGPKPTVMR